MKWQLEGGKMELRSDSDIRESVEHVEVVVRTPAGTWPTEGFFEVPADQKVALLLEHAAVSLKIEDTTNWIAVAGGKKLNPQMSYRANGLTERTMIHYGLDKSVLTG
jgi:hypothetical protein